MQWLNDHVARVYARNVDTDGYRCNSCDEIAYAMRLDIPDHYVCEACYQLGDEYGLHNSYPIRKKGLLIGEIPGITPTYLAMPFEKQGMGHIDMETVKRAVIGTWHACRPDAADIGKLYMRIACVNGESIVTSVVARDILFNRILNVLNWIPLLFDSRFAICCCWNPKSQYFGKTFVYAFDTENVIWLND